MLDLEHEQALIEASRAGDAAAFDILVKRHQEHLYRLMVRACHHPQDAEEVASEAFARAHQRLAQFEGRSAFITWLGRIATNLCFRRLERREPSTVSLDTHQRAATAAPSAGLTPEQLALREEMKQKVRAAVAALPEPDQTVLRLRDIEERSAAETAEQTGLSVAAVKARLHRSRRRLRDTLNSYFLE